MIAPLIDLLRADLAAANFSVTALTGLWGIEADAALHRNQRVPALRALARLRDTLTVPEPTVALAQLFVLGLPVARAEMAAALPSLGLAGAARLGLLAPDTDPAAAGPEPVHPLVELRPHSFVDAHGAGSWWIVSDLGELALGHALGENHVLGVGGASLTLSALMIPTPVDSALDLGTGCGIQALHASRHATRVVATDISERALELAALNARLNGVDNIEFRLGSLFDPVAGERFDHIISNPPFVITPRVDGVPSYEYRDGGLVGDALVEAVVRGAAAHLTPGGVAQMLGNWEYHDDAEAFERMTGWLGGAAEAAAGPGTVSTTEQVAPEPGATAFAAADDAADRTPADRTAAPGSAAAGSASAGSASAGSAADEPSSPSATLDAWIIEREVQLPTAYAETWIRDGGTRPGTPDFDRLYGAWLDDFEARGVRQVGFGYMLLRRPADAAGGAARTAAGRPGAPVRTRLLRLERLPDALGHNPAGIGSHLAECLAAHDWHAGLDDDALSRSTLTVASDVTEERHYWPGQEDPTLLTLHQGGGFGRSVPLDTAQAALIGACDGELPVGAIIDAIAQLLDADEALLRAELLPRVRALLDDGFLTPPTD